MPINGCNDVKLPSLLKTLESPTTGEDEKVEAYAIFSDQVQEDELSFFDLDITYYIEPIVSVLNTDILNKSELVQQGALQVLGFCLHDLELVRLISVESQKNLLINLCKCLKMAEDKATSTRGLWIISKQNIQPDLIVQELEIMMSSINHCLTKWKGQAQTIEYEAVNAIARLNMQAGKEMNNKMKWEKICFSLLIHPASKVREKSLMTLEKGCEQGMNKTTMKEIIPELKSKISGELKKLFNNNEQYILKVWCFLVKYFGEELHQGGFINSLLPLVEMGFKTLEPDVKVMAFKAWKELINNFAMHPNIISDPRRVKLIMQVFKVNNAKVEIVAREKFNTWIYYISKLGAKASVNFDQVVVPLLQFCTGGNKLNTSTSFISTPTTPRFGIKNTSTTIVSPTTPRLSITSTPSQLSTFKTLQLKGLEILAQILGTSTFNYTTDVTMQDIITSPMFFLKQSTVVISCFRELVMSLGNEIPEDLLLSTWSALVGHVKVAVDITPKSDHREMFSYFLSQFQFIALVENISHLMVKMFDPICNIPLKVLSSNVYSVGSGEVMGTPAMFLCEILLSPVLMQSSAQNERYMTIYGKLVNCGFTITTGTLEFSQSVVDIIDRHSQYLPNIELLWRLWSVIANRLLEHIIKTSEINQGDSLEYDFTCLYTALILPIKHKIGSQTVCKSVMKTWSDLYRCFSRQAALVTTAEDNVVCEDFCSRIINSLSTEELKEPSLVDYIVQVLQVVIDCVNFSAFSGATAFNLTGNFSPGKRWMKHKQKPLENLHSFLHVFTDLLTNSIDIAEQSTNTVTFFSKQKTVPSITVAINGLVDIVTTLVTHITNSNIISNMFHKIAEPVSRLYSTSTNKNGTKLYTSAFYLKLEKLWLDISTCLQSRYTSIYDSDFLAKISPLLEATFLHPRRPIKNQTILFWNATFSKSSTLTYPDHLKIVLVKVKEKTPINLPGWVHIETTIIDDTPVSQSQFSQMDAPEPHLPGMPSPHKLRGSFLNKAVSPNIKHSPLKHPTHDTKPVNSAKKRLAIDGLTNNDYVVIKASPKKPRVLTAHQKESLKEKRTIPVMYNNLDQSQSLDISIIQHFNSQSQDQSQPGSIIEVEPSQSSDEVIVIPSSQSESSQQMEKMKSPENSTKPDGTVEFKQPTRGRRRSARFSWDEDELKSSQEKSSGEKSQENESGKKEDLFSSSSLSSSLKQNVEGAIGVGTFETTGSKSSSSLEEVVEKTDKSPEEAGSQCVFSSSLPAGESSPSSVFLTNKSFSQSPKHSAKHSPQRKASSQESRSTSKSPQRKSTSKFNLDSWVVRSPSKGFLQDLGTEDHKEEAEASNVLSETLVEDTQSPTNFQRSNNILENANLSPTPSCNLFETSGVASVPDSPEAVPESPDPLPNAVVKIQKLTKSDLKKYSTGTDDNSTSSSDSEIQFTINKVANDIQGSQGFVSNSTKLERSDSFGFFTKDSYTELDIAATDSPRGISQLLTASQKDQLENVNTDDSMPFGVSQSQSLLKSKTTAERDNQEKEVGYDPTAENTLKDTMSEDNKKSEANSENQTQKSSQQSVSSSGSQSDSDYDPTKVSTFNEDQTKKKRKQMTPKKSPAVLTPRRTPRRHKKRKHFDIEGKDEKNVVDSSSEKSQLESITEEKMETESELAEKLRTSPEVSGQPVKQQKTECESLQKDLNFAVKDENKVTDEFTEDLLSMESQKEVTEHTPEGKKPVKEGKRKSTTKEKMAVAKRRSSRMNEEGTKSRKQLEEDSQKTVVEKIDEKDKATEKEDKELEKSKDSEDSQDLKDVKSCGVELEDPDDSDFKVSKPTRSGRQKNKDDVTDSQQSSQSSTTSQTSTKKSKNLRSTRKNSNVCSPKTHKLRSSGLVLQTRTLRDGKKITLAKLSPIVKRKKQPKTQSAKNSKSEDNSDAESEISIQSDQTNKDIDNEIKESSEMMQENTAIDEADSVLKISESTEIDVNNSDVFCSLLTSPIVNNDSDKSSNQNISSCAKDKLSIKKPSNSDDEVTKLKDINENIPVNTNKESDKILQNTSVLKSIVKEQENLLTKEKTHSPKRDDETPRKFKHAKKRSLTTLMNSDSKVIGLNRFGSRPLMSARGFNIVRRSILQQRSMTDDQTKLSLQKSGSWSPKSSGGHLRSPSASPSTGILKRRLSTNDLYSNSPSPPAKQRRVSFATPIIAGASPSKTVDSINTKPPSPLITNTLTQFTFTGNKFAVGSPSHRRSKHPEKILEDSETPTSQSQPYKSTDETELSAVGPAFPDYTDCDEPVEKILKHLTSSVWSRGLVQLIKSNAHNINTVGDLCRLSEYEINNLPLRTPKLQTLHTALQTLDYNKQTDRRDNMTKDKGGLETVTEEEDEEELPSADEALQKLADDIHHQTEDCDSEDVLKLSQSSDSDNKTEDITTEDSSAMILLDNFLKESDNFSKLSSRELFQLHQKLAMCTNKVMMAMMKKSNSPFNT